MDKQQKRKKAIIALIISGSVILLSGFILGLSDIVGWIPKDLSYKKAVIIIESDTHANCRQELKKDGRAPNMVETCDFITIGYEKETNKPFEYTAAGLRTDRKSLEQPGSEMTVWIKPDSYQNLSGIDILTKQPVLFSNLFMSVGILSLMFVFMPALVYVILTTR